MDQIGQFVFPKKAFKHTKIDQNGQFGLPPKNIPSISCERGCLDNPAFQRKRRFARNGCGIKGGVTLHAHLQQLHYPQGGQSYF